MYVCIYCKVIQLLTRLIICSDIQPVSYHQNQWVFFYVVKIKIN